MDEFCCIRKSKGHEKKSCSCPCDRDKPSFRSRSCSLDIFDEVCSENRKRERPSGTVGCEPKTEADNPGIAVPKTPEKTMSSSLLPSMAPQHSSPGIAVPKTPDKPLSPSLLSSIAPQHSKKRKTADGMSPGQLTMSTLPDEVLLEIFGKLSCNTLINIAPVCKRWSVLTKHRSLWQYEDAMYEKYQLSWFLRVIRAAWHLRSLDLSCMHAENGEVLEAIMNGPVSVKKFNCFCSADPRVIVYLLERYKDSLEELNIVLSDERISYGKGGTFKNGVEPRPGLLLSIIGNMENLRVLRFTGIMPSVASYQGKVNPKWYFGELENPKLQIHALSIKFESPRKVLVEKFVVPFLRGKQHCIKELRLTGDLWKFKEVQEVVKGFTNLKAILRLPVERISVLDWLRKNVFVDIILAGWIDYNKVLQDLVGHGGLRMIEELSLRFCDRLYSNTDDPPADRRLEKFLPALGQKLVSLKRLHIYRWDAPPPFVESVHSTAALHNLLYSVRNSLEELHISDAFRGGRNLPQLMKAVKISAPRLVLTRKVFRNCLGNRGLLFSIRGPKSKIPNAPEFKLEIGKPELGAP